MTLLHFVPWIFIFGAVQLSTSVAHGQNYPIKPVRIITSTTGGSSDFTSRLIAHGLTEHLGQQVIVDNRGNISGEILARLPPDGYNLLIDGASLWIGPLVQKTLYDPLLDFAPVTIAVRAPNVIIVHPSLPVKSVKELIALAKARPGELNYGSGGIGGASHLPAELFKSQAGINIVNVNYKGTGPAHNSALRKPFGGEQARWGRVRGREALRTRHGPAAARASTVQVTDAQCAARRSSNIASRRPRAWTISRRRSSSAGTPTESWFAWVASLPGSVNSS